MAKLSARGRTELIRISKRVEHASVHPIWRQVTLALMSDRAILERRDWQWDRISKPERGAWKVRGKLRADADPQAWLAHKLKEGWGPAQRLTDAPGTSR